MASFTFAGKTIVAPGILVQTIIGANTALSLLPFGTVMLAGASDGGSGFYRFNDVYTAKKALRSGPLLKAIQDAANTGASAGFVAVVLGTKTKASLALGSSNAVISSGDVGTWNNAITFTAIAGTSTGAAVTLTYPDPITGNTVVVGGLGTKYDNLTAYSALATVIANDSLVTPPTAVGLPAIVTLAVTTDAAIALVSTTPLAGATGSGAYTPVLSDVVAGLNMIQDVAWDIGHLVGVYDSSSQAFANSRCVANGPFGLLQRFLHQIVPSGTSSGNTKQQNSAAVANAGVGAAAAMNNFRASVIPQRFWAADPQTGVISLRDAAPFICGLAALVGATDAWGPSSPLTRVYVPGVSDVDYPVLKGTGDQDNAVGGGVMLFETIGNPSPGAVRCVQSVTTQPINPQTGLPWILAEFSGVRGSDALLANVKGMVESMSPRAIGGGNTIGQANAILSGTATILQRALEAQWITGYDRSAITIATLGTTGSDDGLTYDASITPPLNHLGITQVLSPYSYKVSLGGQASSS